MRCRMGQCQNDAKDAEVGVVATFNGKPKVYPICQVCQRNVVPITGVQTVPYDRRGNASLRGGANDVLMVGGRRVTRRVRICVR